MSIIFKGDISVARLDGMANNPAGLTFRCYDSGVLKDNTRINHGDFVSWDGTKWELRPDLSYLINDSENSIQDQIDRIAMGTSSGVDSLGLAKGSVASGNYAVALGHDSKAEGAMSLAALDVAEALGINSLAVGKFAKAGIRNVDTSGSATYALQAAYNYKAGLNTFIIGGTEYKMYSLANNATVTVTAGGQTFEVKNDTGKRALLVITAQPMSISVDWPYSRVWLVDTDNYPIFSTVISKMSYIPGFPVQAPDRVLLLNNEYSSMSSSDDESIGILGLSPDYNGYNAENSIAMMEDALVTGKNALSIGNGAIASTYDLNNPAISIGYYSFSLDGIAIGPNAYSNYGSVSVGGRATSSNYGIAVGGSASAKNHGVALGYNAKALHDNSVAIGNNAEATGNGQIVLGDNTLDPGAAFLFGYGGNNLFKINPDGEAFIMKDGTLTSLHTLLGISPAAPEPEPQEENNG